MIPILPRIPCWVRRSNQYIKINDQIEIPKNLKEDEYKDLYKSLVALPGFMAFNLFVWIFILILIIVMLGIFLEGFNGSN
jgi:hypothetical protein